MTALKGFRQRIAAAREVLRNVSGQPADATADTPAAGLSRFIVADPGLVGNTGHHANLTRYFVQSAKAKGMEALVLAHASAEAVVREELAALPHFRVYTYGTADKDPVCGWLTGFFSSANTTRRDLANIPGLSATDLIYLSGAQPTQLMAAIEWAAHIPHEQCPTIVVELGGEPGVTMVNEAGGERMGIPDPRYDPRATLFRFAARHMAPLKGKPFHVISFEPTISELYRRLMNQPIGVLAFPTPAIIPLRDRGGRRPITVAVLGHQQQAKGYQLMPEVAERLLKEEKDVRLLVHNSDAEQRLAGSAAAALRTVQQRLRDLAARNPRIVLDERQVDFEGWKALVSEADLILCPYDPKRYAMAHSGLASAALANGIPLVVPAKTSLSQWLDEFGRPGVTFDKFDARSIVAAVRRAIKDFDLYASRAHAAALRWVDKHGPDNCVAEMLRLGPADYTVMEPDKAP